MRSGPAAVPAGRTDRFLALLEQAEAGADALTSAELLEAIGQAARLEAVLQARYTALAASAATPLPPPLVQGSRYLDAAAAAEYLGVSKSTVLRLAKARTDADGREVPAAIPARRPSEGVVRFDREDLDAYMGSKQ